MIGLLLIALFFALPTRAATSDPIAPMHYLLGKWDCHGSFAASGKSIASTIRFDLDLAGAAIVKHHDDLAPATYHAMETWVYQPGSKHYATAITDNFGGIRQFSSDGWKDSVLTWRGDVAKPAEKFVYTQVSESKMRVEWQLARDGANFVVGDTLECLKSLPRGIRSS